MNAKKSTLILALALTAGAQAQQAANATAPVFTPEPSIAEAPAAAASPATNSTANDTNVQSSAKQATAPQFVEEPAQPANAQAAGNTAKGSVNGGNASTRIAADGNGVTGIAADGNAATAENGAASGNPTPVNNSADGESAAGNAAGNIADGGTAAGNATSVNNSAENIADGGNGATGIAANGNATPAKNIAADGNASGTGAQPNPTPADSTLQQFTEEPASESPAVALTTANGADSLSTAVAAPDSGKTQTPTDSSTITKTQTNSVAAAPGNAATANAAQPTSHPLDMLHGNAYNQVGNEAAAATVGSDLSMPHKMLGHKFAYFAPIDSMAAVSFGEKNTYFLAFDNSLGLGKITAGAAFGKFGFSIEGAIGKNWVYADYGDYEETYKTTTGGTLVAGTISMKAGNMDLSARGEFVRPNDIGYSNIPNAEAEIRIWDAGGTLTASNSSNSKFAWTAKLNILRHNAETETKTVTSEYKEGATYVTSTKTISTDTTAHIEIIPEFNFGSNILQSEKARVFVGLNTSVPLLFFDQIKDVRSKLDSYTLYTSPNILGEVALGKYVTAFGGASYQWELFRMGEYKLNETDIKSIEIKSGTTDVNLGARFQYESAAVEMAFTKQFLSNPFGSFSDHDEIAVSIGAFILF